jgi:hypothetical protein
MIILFAAGVAAAQTSTVTTTSDIPVTTTFPQRCAALIVGEGGPQCGSTDGYDPIVPQECPFGTVCRPWDNYVCRCLPER